MASAVVMTAFVERLKANWTDTPIADLNMGGNAPVDGAAFLSYDFPVANEEQISLGAPGANVFREDGAFRIVLSIPAGVGQTVDWMTKFDALRAVFRGQFFDGVTAWSASPATINDETDDGGYYELSSAIPYRFDVFG